MKSDIQRELQARIEDFARDVTELLQQAVATSLRDAMPGTGGGRGRGRAGKKAAPAKKAGRRAGGGKAVSEDVVLKEVAREGGRRITQIAESLGTESKAIAKALKALVQAKKVKATGKARGTKYTAA